MRGTWALLPATSLAGCTRLALYDDQTCMDGLIRFLHDLAAGSA